MNTQTKIEKRRAYDREWKRQYKLKNPDKVKEKRRERYHREKQNPEWLKKHKKYMKKYQKEWVKDNPKRQEYRREWMRKLSPEKKIVYTLRNRLKNLLISKPNIKLSKKDESKYKATKELLGTSVFETRKHIESQFKLGMSWKNHGKWHIDHIKPLASFDLTKPEEQKKAFHYTNLQPLWAEDNLRKGAKILD